MHAIAITDFGAAPALIDVPEPTPEPGEVLVRVRASSVNGFDLAVVGGMLKGLMQHRFPVVFGKDFAGTVATAGGEVSGFAAGDEVFGVITKPFLGDGSMAGYVSAGTGPGLAPIPAGLSMAAAGTLGLAGTAALDTVQAIAPALGESVVVAGATGGVGAFATQLAAAPGARVIATAKPGTEADFVLGLGAAHTADYAGDLAAQVRAIAPGGVDAVLHFAGDAAQLASLLVSGGRFASTLGADRDAVGLPDVTVTAIMAAPDQAALDQFGADAAAGRLRVPITRTYPLAEVPQALADFAAGTLGKLAISIG
jgi:NADPH:quinone reductase-like Zn-dependent oxidoreductase